MISIIFLPIILTLIYYDFRLKRINIIWWKALFPLLICFFLLINPTHIILVVETLYGAGLLLSTFIFFLILVKIIGGADILFLIFLFFSATDEYLIGISTYPLFFLEKLVIFLVCGIICRGRSGPKNLDARSSEYSETTQNLQTLKKKKNSVAPQFLFIFLSFL